MANQRIVSSPRAGEHRVSSAQTPLASAKTGKADKITREDMHACLDALQGLMAAAHRGETSVAAQSAQDALFRGGASLKHTLGKNGEPRRDWKPVNKALKQLQQANNDDVINATLNALSNAAEDIGRTKSYGPGCFEGQVIAKLTALSTALRPTSKSPHTGASQLTKAERMAKRGGCRFGTAPDIHDVTLLPLPPTVQAGGPSVPKTQRGRGAVRIDVKKLQTQLNALETEVGSDDGARDLLTPNQEQALFGILDKVLERANRESGIFRKPGEAVLISQATTAFGKSALSIAPAQHIGLLKVEGQDVDVHSLASLLKAISKQTPLLPQALLAQSSADATATLTAWLRKAPNERTQTERVVLKLLATLSACCNDTTHLTPSAMGLAAPSLARTNGAKLTALILAYRQAFAAVAEQASV